MPKNLDLTDMRIVSQIISETKLTDERDRKIHSFDSWMIYSGNQKNYVEKELQRTRPNAWQSYSISNISIAKMAVDKLSKSYKQQPKRSVDGNELKSEALYNIYDEADAKLQLPYADKLLNLHKYFLMWVDYDEAYEKYRFWALQPHEFTVVRDKKTGELLAVILNYANKDELSSRGLGDGIDTLIADQQADSSAESKIYAMWSKENFVVIKSENKTVTDEFGNQINQVSVTYVDDPNNPNKINPIGVIPFVFVSKEPAIDYPTPNPLAYNSVTFNALNSEGLTAANIQGTSIGVLSYPEKFEGSFKNMTQGLTSLVKLPQSSNPSDKETSLRFESPSPDLAGQREYYMSYAKQILSEMGIASAQGVSGGVESFSSALEKMISETPVQHIIEENQELFVDMEKYMFEVIKAYDDFYGFGKFNLEDDIQIVFQKPKMLVSDSENLDKIERMLKLGLIEEWEKFKIIDPNLSDDEAKEKLEKINKEKEDRANKMRGLFGNRDQQSDEDSGLEQSGVRQDQEQTDEGEDQV